MTAHLCSKGHLLTPALKEICQTRAEHLLQWHVENGHENIFFTDDKILTIEEQYNNQNNKIYAQTSLEVSSECTGSPSHFLPHSTVSHQGVTTLHFCKKGVKLVPECIEDMLQGVVKPLNTTVFNGQQWVFPQGVQTSTPWTVNCGQHVLKNKAYQKHHNNLDSLKRSLVKAETEIPLETVSAATAEWPECSKSCIEA